MLFDVIAFIAAITVIVACVQIILLDTKGSNTIDILPALKDGDS